VGLTLGRLSRQDVLKRASFLIRKQIYRELCGNNDVEAMHYLQTAVIASVSVEEEEAEFRDMASWLFDANNDGVFIFGGSANDSDVYARRTKLYEQLVEFFPTTMTQPSESLLELLPW